MTCRICKNSFRAGHFNQFICSPDCKRKARKQNLARYNRSDRRKAATTRYLAKPKTKRRLKAYLKEYYAQPHAKRLAVIRSARNLKNNPKLLAAKRERDRLFAKTKKGRAINRAARAKYSRTDGAREVRRIAKAARRVAYRDRFSVTDWLAIVSAFGGCAKCRAPKVEVDHIVPISKGGRNTIDNVQPLCRSCNSSKGARTIRYELPQMQQTA